MMNEVVVSVVLWYLTCGFATPTALRRENEVAAMTRSRLFHLYENICHPMDKCNTTAHFSDRTCFCDQFCRILNDCCYDKHRKLPPTRQNIQLIRDAIQCSDVEGLDDYHMYANVNFYIMKNCPHTVDNQTVRRLCENDFYEDRFLDLMVLSRETGVLYRNMYCALCWGEIDAEFWRLKMDCPMNITIPEANTTMDLSDSKNSLDGCIFRQIPPKDDDYNALRRCENTINSECKNTWASTFIHQHCGLHSSYIRDAKTKRVYKNFHCAICNDVVAGDLRCTTISELDLVFFPPRPVETSSVTPMRTLYLDLNDNEMVTEEGDVFPLTDCEGYHALDPFVGRCRRLQCPRSHEMTDEEACDDTRAKLRAARKTLVDSFNNCSMFVYQPRQYTKKANGTIRIHSAFHDFQPGSYLLVNGSVYICRDVVRHLSKHMFPGLDAESWEGIVFTGSVIVALVGVIVHGVYYFLAPELRTLRGRCLMSLDSCLIIAEGILIAGTQETTNRTTCVVAAVFLHYFILAAFCWKNIIAYDLVTSVWRIRRNVPPKNSRRFVAFCLYGWFLPATIVGISIRLDQIPALHPFVPDYGHARCWVSNMEALLIIYLAPICLILLSDLIMHIITITDLYTEHSTHTPATQAAIQAATQTATQTATQVTAPTDIAEELEKNRTDLMVHLKLFLLMGITWLIAYFGSFSKNAVLWYLFSGFNLVQGVYMAFIHILNPIAREGAWHTVKEAFDAIFLVFRNFRRKRLKKNNQIHRKRKPTPVDV